MRDTFDTPEDIPLSALVLGLAGVIPFIWGAATIAFPALFDLGQSVIGPRFVGQYVQLQYGTIILAFMSGVLWGFATKATGSTAAVGYSLSVIPALWAFFFVGGGVERATFFLIAGYLMLLGLDYVYWRYGLTPAWWMKLRNLLTVLVVGSLTAGLLL